MRKKAEPQGHTHILHNRHKPMTVQRCLLAIHFDKLFQTPESTSFWPDFVRKCVMPVLRFHLKFIAAIFTATCIYCFWHHHGYNQAIRRMDQAHFHLQWSISPYNGLDLTVRFGRKCQKKSSLQFRNVTVTAQMRNDANLPFAPPDGDFFYEKVIYNHGLAAAAHVWLTVKNQL